MASGHSGLGRRTDITAKKGQRAFSFKPNQISPRKAHMTAAPVGPSRAAGRPGQTYGGTIGRKGGRKERPQEAARAHWPARPDVPPKAGLWERPYSPLNGLRKGASVRAPLLARQQPGWCKFRARPFNLGFGTGL